MGFSTLITCLPGYVLISQGEIRILLFFKNKFFRLNSSEIYQALPVFSSESNVTGNCICLRKAKKMKSIFAILLFLAVTWARNLGGTDDYPVEELESFLEGKTPLCFNCFNYSY